MTAWETPPLLLPQAQAHTPEEPPMRDICLMLPVRKGARISHSGLKFANILLPF